MATLETQQHSVEQEQKLWEVWKVKNQKNTSLDLHYLPKSVKFAFHLEKDKDGNVSINSITAKEYPTYRTSVHHADEKFKIDTTSITNFKSTLDYALQMYNAKISLKVPELEELYKSLGYGDILKKNKLEAQQVSEKQKEEATKKLEASILKEFKNWDEDKKQLTYQYTHTSYETKNGISKKNARIITVSLQQQGDDSTLITLFADNLGLLSLLKSNAGKPVEVVVKNKEDIRPTIQSTLSKGLGLKNGESVQVNNYEWFEKAEKKADLAVKAYEYYLKHPQPKKK